MSTPSPVSAKQCAFLESLTAPERLAALTSSEAAFLIGFLSDRPPNMSRTQQLYAYRLLGEVPREHVARVIGGLVRLSGRTPATTATAATPALVARAIEVCDDGADRRPAL